MRIPIWMVALGVAGVAATGVGCSGGDDDDDDDGGSGLQTGTYAYSGSASTLDECNLGIVPGDLDGLEETVVTVTATSVTFQTDDGPFTLPRAGNNIGEGPQSVFTVDWSDTVESGLTGIYNCQEEDFVDIAFTITSETSLDYSYEQTWTVVTGSASACEIANGSAGFPVLAFPCESNLTSTLDHT